MLPETLIFQLANNEELGNRKEKQVLSPGYSFPPPG